jgi:2'-5' RNA ligase
MRRLTSRGWRQAARVRCGAPGSMPEPRKYKPHVTLAYCYGTADFDVANFLQDAAEFRTDRFWVDHFCMYSSRATKAGSRYVEEAVYPLTGVSA